MSGDSDWSRNRFDDITFSTQILNTEEKEKLIEISCDYELKRSFRNLSLINFWLSLRNKYPLLAEKAATVLLPFSTTYLCEKAFSSYAHLKTKYRNRLDAEPDLRLFIFLQWFRTSKSYAEQRCASITLRKFKLKSLEIFIFRRGFTRFHNLVKGVCGLLKFGNHCPMSTQVQDTESMWIM
ncbi:unnamed protein product [Lepidochelys kempii]